MKKINFLLFFFLLTLAISCSKDDDPSTKCSFTFKNNSYTGSDVLCDNVPSGTTMTTYGGTTNAVWTLTLGSDSGAGAIWFNLNSVDYLLKPGATYKAELANKTYTFNGTLYNDDDETDFAEISGTCTCTREQ
jgi:hypothetical protein